MHVDIAQEIVFSQAPSLFQSSATQMVNCHIRADQQRPTLDHRQRER